MNFWGLNHGAFGLNEVSRALIIIISANSLIWNSIHVLDENPKPMC